MKKCCWILAIALLLCGCGVAETFETVDDAVIQPVMQAQKKICLSMEEADVILEGETGAVYLCDGYEVAVEVLSAGNLTATFQALTGFAPEELTVMETAVTDAARYESVWTAASEEGVLVCRTVILDDGAYHYCITFSAAAEDAQELQDTWRTIAASFQIA